MKELGSWSLMLAAWSLNLYAWGLMLAAWCLRPWVPVRNKTITLAAPGHIPSGHFYDALAARISEGSHWAGPLEDRFHSRILQGLPLQSWITYILQYPSCQWLFMLEARSLRLGAWSLGLPLVNACIDQLIWCSVLKARTRAHAISNVDCFRFANGLIRFITLA